MCGIAGALFWDPRGGPRDHAGIVQLMVDAMAHRGPDGHGLVECASQAGDGPAVVFGHTRLAILDLSERAAQPMKSPTQPIWISYNGEVYNFESLREELKQDGREFRSTSDTEVVLQAYEAWGMGCVARLRGMFAFAVWDGRTQTLLLARDRMGIKPLYFHRGESCLVFGSEVRALLASGLVPRRLDRIGLEQYLAHQTVPAPRTLVEGVRLLEPGHIVQVTAGGQVEDRCYWDLLDASPETGAAMDEGAVRAGVRSRLVEATEQHLVSDVPVGVFLSGGIDSSALVALMRDAGVQPHTFTVVLPGTPHDEAPFAAAMARRFNAVHTEIAIGEEELSEDITQAIASVDHPSGDGINTFVVSRAVRRAGVKVALSGLGGDELFGGYPSFRRIGHLTRYAGIWRRSPGAMRSVAAAAVRALGRGSVGSAKAAALLETDGSVAQSFPVMRQMFSARQRRELLGAALVAHSADAGDPYVALLEDAARRHPARGPMALVSYAEARTYMHDVLLRDTDQMSMAHGLEVRVPLLDHVLAEYVMGLPDEAKAPGDQPKRLLVESLGSELPAECVDRPKQGFVLPFDQWMRGDLRGLCEEHLGPRGLSGRGIFREEAVSHLWTDFLAGDKTTNWARPWTLVALDAWMARNGIEA